MKKVIVVLIAVIILVIIRMSPIGKLFTFENLVSYGNRLEHYVNAHFILSSVVFIFVYILTVSLSIPGATILTLAGGFLFGVVRGVIFVNIGATTGAIIIFIISKYLLGNYLQGKYKNTLSKFNNELKKNGTYYLLTLRLIPVFPFFLINIMAGLSNIRLSTFVWTTALGIIPGSAVYCAAGARLGQITSVKDIFTKETLLVVLLLALLALIPVIISKLKKSKNPA